MTRPLIPILLALTAARAAAAQPVSAADYDSLQAAIDANPGRMIHLPEGDYRVTQKVRIGEAGGGLYGFGRIVQENPEQIVLEIEHAQDVRIRDITLTRAGGAQDAAAPGLFCWDCTDVTIENVRIVDCRARDAAVSIRECTRVTVRDCEIRNYKRIAVDDRTGPGENLYGYAFRAIDGTGVMAERAVGTVIESNRIVETRLLPTRELKEQHGLGSLCDGRHPTRPGKLGMGPVLRGYVSNWHQGSAIVVTGPKETRHTTVRGNYIENAAQGIDLHCDLAVVAENTVNHGMMGIKATHGSRNLVITGNLLTHIDLWGILLNPGAASHHAQPADGDKPAQPANTDGGTIIANNIITDYGHGHEYWNWGGAADDLGNSFAIALYEGQLDTNPPLHDVLVTGNLVYAEDAAGPPRHRYAVYIGPWNGRKEPGPTFPQRVHFADNLFMPGAAGVSNIPLPE